MATLAMLGLWGLLSCGTKSVPSAPAPKPIPISYGVTYTIDDAESYDPDLLLQFKSSVQNSLERADWEKVSLSVEPYTDVYAIEHQGFAIEGSSILSIPDVQVNLFYTKKTQQLLLSLEFLYQEWQTQTRVELSSGSNLEEVASAAIEALLSHVAQAQMDAKIPYGVSIMLSMAPNQSTSSHHYAERYRYLRWQGLVELLWSTGVQAYADKPYGNPNLSVINTVEVDPIAVLGTLQGNGLACKVVGRSRTTQRLHCVLPEVDNRCVEQTVEWSLAARKASSVNICLDGECERMSCDDKYCCLELNLDDDSDKSRLCQATESDTWFLGLDDCQGSIF